MTKEDAILTQSLRKLKIESVNVNRSLLNSNTGNESLDAPNPMFRKRSKSLSNLDKCSCDKKNFMHLKPSPFKKLGAKKKLLRDPILNFVKYNNQPRSDPESSSESKKIFGECSMTKEQDFKSLVQACKKISLSHKSDSYASKSFRQFRFCKNKVGKSEGPQLSDTCAHQARLNISPPCDVTIDELASYFETFVHIPKKMSVMAEMMYI